MLERILTYEFSLMLILLASPFAIGKMFFKERIILAYVAVIFIFDIWGISIGISGKDNWHIYNTLMLLDTSLLVVYLNSILNNKFQKRALNIGLSLFILSCLICIGIFGFHSKILLINSMFGDATLSIFFLLFLIYGQTGSKWISNVDNWISVGSLFYLIGSIPFRAMFIYLLDKKQDLAITLFDFINMSLSHFRFLLIFIGIILIIKRKTVKQVAPEVIE